MAYMRQVTYSAWKRFFWMKNCEVKHFGPCLVARMMLF